MVKKLPSDVIDDAIKLKLNSISSYDASRLLGVSDTWVDKIWQLYRCVRDEHYDKVAESINLRYAGVHTVEHIFKKCKKTIPENVQAAIDRKSGKKKEQEVKQESLPKADVFDMDVHDLFALNAKLMKENYDKLCDIEDKLTAGLGRLIQLWEK